MDYPKASSGAFIKILHVGVADISYPAYTRSLVGSPALKKIRH
jgi:hypothetical protein